MIIEGFTVYRCDFVAPLGQLQHCLAVLKVVGFVAVHANPVVFGVVALLMHFVRSSLCAFYARDRGLTFSSARIHVRALIGVPRSQPTVAEDHISCVVRALMPRCRIKHCMCVIAKRLDCLLWPAHAAGHRCFLSTATSKRTVSSCLQPLASENLDQQNGDSFS